MEENNKIETTSVVEKEGSNFGWGVLGFFLPLVGLILFLVWMKDKKKAAKASGLGALIGFLLEILVIAISIPLGLGSLFSIGVSSYESEMKKDKTSTEVKKNDNKKKDDTKKEDMKKEDTKQSNIVETADPNDLCNVKATSGDLDYLYNFNYDESCETTKILDDNNNVLFSIKNKILFLNDGEEFDIFNNSFYKVGNSLILYSSACSPGYCYVYVYNIEDKTGFKVTSAVEKDDLLAPIIGNVGIAGSDKLTIDIRWNESAGLDSLANDPRVILLGKIRSCEISDIDQALREYGLDDFAISKTYSYDIKNGKIENKPTITVYRTVKYYYSSYTSICSGNR